MAETAEKIYDALNGSEFSDSLSARDEVSMGGFRVVATCRLTWKTTEVNKQLLPAKGVFCFKCVVMVLKNEYQCCTDFVNFIDIPFAVDYPQGTALIDNVSSPQIRHSNRDN